MKEPKAFITDISFNFAKSIIKYCDFLYEKGKYNISNQLFRSGTSIGANIAEAQHAESKADFIHKMKIASKESEETGYWLRLCISSENYASNPELLKDLISIQTMLSKIISTSKRNHH